ncbi:MAG: hypothetical protein R6U88_04730 [Candidatus Bipolaricaulota bacterium]
MALAGLKALAVLSLAAALGGCALLGQPEMDMDFWQPSLSPDGTQMVYVGEGPESYDLFVLDVEEGSERALTSTGREELYPSWCPEGEMVAFMAMQEEDNWDIFTVEVDTGDVFRVTADPGLDVNPSWAASGEIVFNSDRDGPWAAYAIQPDGTGLRRLSIDRPQSD